MGNLKQRKKLWLLAWVLVAGCGQNVPVTKKPVVEEKQKAQAAKFEGKFTAIDNEAIDLSKSDQPFVLIFASDTCATCTAETRALGKLFNEKGGLPVNVDLYTILIGALVEDAQDWKDYLSVRWTVGIDPGDQLFRQYCQEALTPCVLVFNHINGKITKFIGESGPEELQKESGEWIYAK